jgi:hypothetical protein
MQAIVSGRFFPGEDGGPLFESSKTTFQANEAEKAKFRTPYFSVQNGVPYGRRLSLQEVPINRGFSRSATRCSPATVQPLAFRVYRPCRSNGRIAG